MSRYVFPAVFTKESVGGYSINFPDVECCFTQGENLIDGMYMASDVLALMLHELESDNKPIPRPSALEDIATDENSFVTYVSCDTEVYADEDQRTAI